MTRQPPERAPSDESGLALCRAGQRAVGCGPFDASAGQEDIDSYTVTAEVHNGEMVDVGRVDSGYGRHGP